MLWAATREDVKKRLGLDYGTDFNDMATAAMTQAGELLHSVKWGFLYTVNLLTIPIATSARYTASDGDISTVGTVDSQNVKIGTSRVIEGTVQSILSNTAPVGKPNKYVFYNGAFHFGCPMADAQYPASLPNWKKFIVPAETSAPEIISYLGDAIFIAASVWTFAKYFETEEETRVVSGDAMNELIIAAKAAQSRQSFQGPSLEEIIRRTA